MRCPKCTKDVKVVNGRFEKHAATRGLTCSSSGAWWTQESKVVKMTPKMRLEERLGTVLPEIL